jgi:bla regulator protein blaR1
VESPLTCVSGVTGADLNKRIIRIMTQYSPGELGFGKKLLLLAVVVAAVAIPIVFGLLNAPQIRAQSTQSAAAPLPLFEVASISVR